MPVDFESHDPETPGVDLSEGTNARQLLTFLLDHEGIGFTVGGRSHLDERTRRRIEAAREGDDLEDAEPVLYLGSYTELNRLLTPTNLELLETIAEHDPESISAAAELVDRDYKQVHRNLTELADIGVIEFEAADPGQPKRPLLAYDGLEIDIPFTPSDGDGSAVAP